MRLRGIYITVAVTMRPVAPRTLPSAREWLDDWHTHLVARRWARAIPTNVADIAGLFARGGGRQGPRAIGTTADDRLSGHVERTEGLLNRCSRKRHFVNRPERS